MSGPERITLAMTGASGALGSMLAETLAEAGWDMVLTDLHLKGTRNGLELAESLSTRRKLPVGVMTSLPAAALLRRAVRGAGR